MRLTVLKNIFGKRVFGDIFGMEIKAPSKIGPYLYTPSTYLVTVWTACTHSSKPYKLGNIHTIRGIRGTTCKNLLMISKSKQSLLSYIIEETSR